jgi:hypothetical protein
VTYFVATGCRERKPMRDWSGKLFQPPLFLVVAMMSMAAAESLPQGFQVHAVGNRDGGRITIHGLDPAALTKIDGARDSAKRWASLCGIVVRPDIDSQRPQAVPLLGSYRVLGRTLQFHSRYPLDLPGYRVLVDSSLLAETDRKRFTENQQSGPLVLELELADLPLIKRSAAEVVSVYPSAKVLPENLLRFYFHFSAPMGRGEAYRHIRLLNSTGQAVSDPFLELNEELWSADGRRFTLLFDPGRIKRGLKPREEVGPVLEEGKSYTLVIDRQWPDALGEPLAREFRRSFQAGPPDTASPSPRDWKIKPSAAGTRQPLEVDFPESLDSALARRLIVVRDGRNRIVEGRVRLESEESRWSLTPESAWLAGDYRLEAGLELEDLAGNAIGRPFEVDLVGPISARVETTTVSTPFRIGPGGQ